MTPAEAQKLLPIIKAYAEGHTIEHLSYGKWTTMGNPNFNDPPCTYRIAPAKVRVKGLLNVYPDSDPQLGTYCTGPYPDRPYADSKANPGRIACVEIDVEGERLG